MISFGWLFIPLLLVVLVNGSAVTRGQGGKFVLCHFEGAAAVRPQEEVRFTPEDVDVTICTHVVYNRAVINRDLEVVPRDRAVDLWEDGGRGLYNRTLKLKELNPGLKVFIDVYDSDGELGKHLASGNRSALTHFVENAASFVQSHGFDGMDIRITRNSKGFEDVVMILHEQLVEKGIKLMTFLLPIEYHTDEEFTLTEPLSRKFDLVVLGSYWRLPSENTEIFSSAANLERRVEELTSRGIPSQKLVVAIPAFSISVKLCNRSESGIGSEICCSGSEGMYETRHKMLLHNSEVIRKMANTSEDWVVVRDPVSRVPYGHTKSLQWMSFEDPESIREKAKIILERNLAGAAIMNLDMEDFKGGHTEGGETFPLTRATFEALNGSP